MSVYRSDNPDFDLKRWEREQQEWEDSLPRCEGCGEPIDEYVWEIDDEILCEECAKAKFRRDVEDYMGGGES